MPRPSPVPLETWAKIQAEYQAGKGKITCKELAEKYGCKPAVVSGRCRREGWVTDGRRRAKVGAELSTKIVESVVERASIGLQRQVNAVTDDATRFVAQQLRTSFMLAGKLEKRFESEADSLKPKDLQSLTGAWKNTVDIGRQALRLDEQKDNSLHFHLHGSMRPDANALTIDAETVPSTLPVVVEPDKPNVQS